MKFKNFLPLPSLLFLAACQGLGPSKLSPEQTTLKANVQSGVLFLGPSFAQRSAENAQTCNKFCNEDSLCLAWTFHKETKEYGAHCKLKNSPQEKLSADCCISGVKSKTPRSFGNQPLNKKEALKQRRRLVKERKQEEAKALAEYENILQQINEKKEVLEQERKFILGENVEAKDFVNIQQEIKKLSKKIEAFSRKKSLLESQLNTMKSSKGTFEEKEKTLLKVDKQLLTLERQKILLTEERNSKSLEIKNNYEQGLKLLLDAVRRGR